jgi:transcription-repair coupling factor (superfamily II helicase)
MLKEVAEKRLAAIKEYTELGSGFKIAMRDLEIRGAGNLLGAEQHGHMEAVGYDLYCKMLNEAVKTAKGIPVEESFDTAIDIVIDAYIPPEYIPNEFQKLDIYKRIAGIESEEESEEITEELIDRFGDLPRSVENLLYIAKIKCMAHSVYFTEVSQKSDRFVFTMYEKAGIDVAKLPQFVESFGGTVKFTADAKAPYFAYYYNLNSRQKGVNPLECLEDFLERAKSLLMCEK